MWPRPRPEIIGTGTPQAATSGASARLTLSPTPPVECLSILRPGTEGKPSTSPESRIASVSVAVSSASIPRQQTAIRNAPSCASLSDPSTAPWTTSRI